MVKKIEEWWFALNPVLYVKPRIVAGDWKMSRLELQRWILGRPYRECQPAAPLRSGPAKMETSHVTEKTPLFSPWLWSCTWWVRRTLFLCFTIKRILELSFLSLFFLVFETKFVNYWTLETMLWTAWFWYIASLLYNVFIFIYYYISRYLFKVFQIPTWV